MLDINQIMQILPHRYPFLLIDKVTNLVLNESIEAYKNVTIGEPIFEGHFPGHPIYPGVMIIEGMAQAGGVLAFRSMEKDNPDDLKDKKRLMILDQIEDPHNLGAIIRSAEAFGFDGIIISERRSAKVNSTVYKTSAGAINNIDIAMVKNINRAIKEIKKENFWVYGLAGEADGDITQTDLTGKIALVVGNEGKGLSRLVRENCDGLIKIPMLGKINSLNASVASAIAIYESLRQNGFN